MRRRRSDCFDATNSYGIQGRIVIDPSALVAPSESKSRCRAHLVSEEGCAGGSVEEVGPEQVDRLGFFQKRRLTFGEEGLERNNLYNFFLPRLMAAGSMV